MTRSDRDLTKGPIPRVLFRMSWPMTIGILATMSVSLADAFFLGRQGTVPLAAISFTFPVVLTLMSLSIGLGAGTSSVVSRAIGEDDEKKMRHVSTDALFLCVLLTTLISIVGFVTIRPVFTLLGAKGETLELVVTYMRIWYFGLPALAVMMVASNLLRASGDSRSPAVMMVGVAILNVALNAILIPGFGPVPEMGIAGAGWASFASRLAALALGLWLITMRDRMVTLAGFTARRLVSSWREVGAIAVPAAVGNAVNPLGIAIVTGLVASFGDAAVAAFGTATRIESFVSIPMLALSAAIGPIAGQNFGKGMPGRVGEALRASYIFHLAWSLSVALGLFLAARMIMSQFSGDGEVVDIGTLYLQLVPLTLAGYGVTVVASGAFNAIGRPLTGLGFYLIRTAALYVPLGWIAVQLSDERGLFIAIGVANVVAGIVIAWLSLSLIRGEKRRSEPARAA